MQSEYSTELRVNHLKCHCLLKTIAWQAKIIELIDKPNDVYYQIEFVYDKRRRWYVDRTFKEFCDLHSKLHKKIPNMPLLPEKYFFKPSFQQLQKRKVELEKYINVKN